MATAKNKTNSQVEAAAPVDSVAIAPDLNLEEAIADELLASVDWQKVMTAIIRKAPQKLFNWLTSGNDRPVNISAYPELTALPSSEDRAA